MLDAYAGTGAIGIEGLSHGAAWVDFIERDPALCRLIRENLKAAGFEGKAHVYCSTVHKAVAFLREPYDVVFMDPPYADAGAAEAVAEIAAAGLLRDGGVLVVEHAWRAPWPQQAGTMSLVRTRRYGDSALSLYRKEES